MRGDAHRRGRVQESGRLRWILSSEMGHVTVLGSSMWMWLMLRIERVNMISEEDKNNIPKLVRAMQLNIRCTKDEWLAGSTVTNKRRRRITVNSPEHRCQHGIRFPAERLVGEVGHHKRPKNRYLPCHPYPYIYRRNAIGSSSSLRSIEIHLS